MPAARFVTLSAYTTLPEARQAAERLKAAGIPAYIRGEAAALIAADPDRTVVRLEVVEDDLEHAERVLASPPGAEAIRPAAPDRQSPPEAADNDTTDPDADRLATVEVFYDSLDAKHAADLLRAKGIPCSLEGTSEGVLPGLGPGIVALRLSVRGADLERAYEVLGFTIDDGEREDDVPEGGVPKSDHFQEAEPRSSREVKRPPFVQPEAEGVPVESPSAAADDLGPRLAAPTVEAGAEGADINLILLLLVLGGLAVAAAIWFVLL
jgi:hypothetical protein